MAPLQHQSCPHALVTTPAASWCLRSRRGTRTLAARTKRVDALTRAALGVAALLSGAVSSSVAWSEPAATAASAANASLAATVLSFLGSADVDEATATVVEASGTVIIGGRTCGADFPWTVDLRSAAGGCDAFVARLARDGSKLLFAAVLGGSGDDEIADVAADAVGDIYVAGSTDSADFPTRNAAQPHPAGGTEAFITKIDRVTGEIVWSTFLGGSKDDSIDGIAVDASERVWVIGRTVSNDLPLVRQLAPSLFVDRTDTFVASIAPSGLDVDLLTALRTKIRGLVLDETGRAYLAGNSNPESDCISACERRCNDSDVVVAIIAADGSSVDYSTTVAGSRGDLAGPLQITDDGDIVVIGTTCSPDLATPGAFDVVQNGYGYDFVARVAPFSSQPRWATYFDLQAGQGLVDVAITPEDRVVLLGNAWDAAGPSVLRSRDGARSVQPTQSPRVPQRAYAPPGGGFAFDPFHPAIVFRAGTNGGFVSRDYGAHWEPLFDYFYRIVVHPFVPDRVFAVDGSNVHRSIDGGRTWQFLGLPGAGCEVGVLAMDRGSPAALFVGGLAGLPDFANPHPVLCRSIDEGATWEVRDLGLPRTEPLRHLVIDPVRPERLYAVMPSGIYTSDNHGVSWTRTSTGLGVDPSALAIAPSESSTLYAIANAALFRSRDAGAFWEIVSIPRPGGPLSVAVHPTDADVVLVGAPDSLYRSDDAGRTLVPARVASPTMIAGITAVAVHPRWPELTYALSIPPARRDTTLYVLSEDGRSLLASHMVAGALDDTAAAVAASSSGEVWITGLTESPDLPTLNALQPSLRGPRDVFVARLETSDDADGDGIPTAWELATGLDATQDDAAEDPDGDGVTNAEEYAARSHPRGAIRRYLAEGATDPFFVSTITVANPDPDEGANVVLRFLDAGGLLASEPLRVPAHASRTLVLNDRPGLSAAEFSTLIESDREIGVGRVMTWDGRAYGSHAQQAVDAPSSQWYFAEGATTFGFQLFYLLQNPNSTEAEVTLTWLPADDRGQVIRTYTLAPLSRLTIWANVIEALHDVETGLIARSAPETPIVVERAMYLDAPGQMFAAGHGGAGATAPATAWYFAEGATGEYFDLFLLLANPDTEEADVEVQYLRPEGSAITGRYRIAPGRRLTIWVDQEDPLLESTAVGTTVRTVNGVPIVAERAMWWPGPSAATWHGAHAGFGIAAPASRWILADGEVGGERHAESYVLLTNVGSAEAAVRVTLLLDGGGTASELVTVRPQTRRNVAAASENWTYSAPWVRSRLEAGTPFAVLVEGHGTPDLVVEGAVYHDEPSQGGWAAGRVSAAAPVP
jgi:hypothetical protein